MVDDDDECIKVSANMIKYGGGFVEKLGEALMRADKNNVEKIRIAFPEYWEDYKNIKK